MSSIVAAVVAAEEAAHRELPIPPVFIGLIALLAFALLLGVTWSFRGTHHKYARPQYGDGTSSGSDRSPDDPGRSAGPHAEAHWPEHPGNH